MSLLGFYDFVSTLIEGAINLRMKERALVRREAEALTRQAGAAAFDTAQQVAAMARERGDHQSTKLWLKIASEIARREPSQRT
ncbi:hypothetical protein [Enterovirga rhinocerotis]|uniref:ANTAR domain-containing protein n=1 Tax=Enterovirga rhinocerotis TaxID=1339210 RepID=A0A4R7BRU8_9HYPH|nr:hypothetical protein [Enterovirga rhinocerotis]TDR87185.1 hypothetical protein EV668_4265 [Enterovirga rhinocerotis]